MSGLTSSSVDLNSGKFPGTNLSENIVITITNMRADTHNIDRRGLWFTDDDVLGEPAGITSKITGREVLKPSLQLKREE